MDFESYKGKIIKKMRKTVRGHYECTAYEIEFTDGTTLRFEGNSSADVELYEIKEEK